MGVKLITGTDAGLPSSLFTGFAPALRFYEEHIGFEPADIIEMATVTSGAALGEGETIGRLAPVFSADLLVVDGDPLTDMATLARPRLVLAAGREADLNQAPHS